MDPKLIEEKYKFEKQCIINFLKSSAINIVREMCSEITNPYPEAYSKSKFYTQIKKELTNSRFENAVPFLNTFSESSFSNWQQQTQAIILDPSNFSKKVVSDIFTEYPKLKQGLIADMEFAKSEYKNQQKIMYYTLGGICGVTLLGAMVVSRG